MSITQPLQAVLLNETAIQRHIGCELVGLRIEQECRRAGIRIVAKCPNNHDWEWFQDVISSADLCIVNGEGTIHDDKHQGVRLLEAAEFCNDKNIPIVLVNALYQNNGARSDELLRLFDRVYLRDSLSQIEARKAGCKSAKVVPDLTLSFKDFSPFSASRDELVRIFDGSVMPEVNKSLFTISVNTKSKFVPISAKIRDTRLVRENRLRRKWRNKNTKSAIRGSFALLAYKFLRYAGIRLAPSKFMATHLPASPDIHTYIKQLQTAKSLTTGRFHGCCIALVTQTPFYAVSSNSHKIEALLEDCGLTVDQRLRPIDDPTLDSGPEPFSSEERSAIETYLDKAQTASQEMFREIAELGHAARLTNK